MRNHGPTWALLACATLAAVCPADAATLSIPKIVFDYAALHDRVRLGAAGAKVEALYALGNRAVDSLMAEGPDGKGRVIESMDSVTFAQTESLMSGFDLNREEFVGCAPQVWRFLALAGARGDAADRDFFHALGATYGGEDSTAYAFWRDYTKQQTDYSGCTLFGTGRLVAAYGRWTACQAAHPGRYGRWVREEVAAVEDGLTQPGCACGDQASVEHELSEFLRRFPAVHVAARVRQQLRLVRAGRSHIRFHCTSG